MSRLSTIPEPDATDLSLGMAEFRALQTMIREITGINLGDGKRQMVERRLAVRVRALGLDGFPAYLEHLRTGNATETEEFINAITTNLTSFFRENHHFEYLRTVIAQLSESRPANGRRLRIWSAGCSTGEEPYSLAITLLEAMGDLHAWDARVLATDLDSNVLARAKAGSYPAESLDCLPRKELRQWFQRGTGPNAGRARIKPAAADLITFQQLNLLAPWPMRGPFDVIFCRNVMIYFDKETQRQLVDRFANMLVTDGHLLIGHSESLFNVSDRFRLIGQTIYRKCR